MKRYQLLQRYCIYSLVSVLTAFFIPSPVFAELSDAVSGDEVYMVKGELVTLKVDSVTRLSLVDPAVADIVNAEGDEILLVGQEVGQTILFVWDAQGKRVVRIYVFSQDLELVKERIQKLLKAADIQEAALEINANEGKVVVSGEIPSYKKAQFDQIVAPFGADLMNMAREEEVNDLIQIDVQITELSTTLSKSLGINWTAGSSESLTFAYPETMPSTDGSISDYFKIGDFNRTSALLATVNALISEGKAHVLSQPKLVVVSGQSASFLVGGEIPIRTAVVTNAADSSGVVQEDVTFKSYGISMTVTPTIKREKVDIDLTTTISDIDAANTTGDDVAFTTRTAQTKLYLDDGQTIVLAGLIKNYRNELLKKVPFLGDIPVLGLLFRNKSKPTADVDQELVISLTPTIIDKNRSGPKKKETAAAQKSSAAAGGSRRNFFPSPRPGMGTGEIPRDMEEYVRSIQKRIAGAIVYPQEAERYGWEGTVKLGLLILNDGTLATALVRESSGYEIFDEYALNIARNAAPYASFPPGTDLKELSVTVPIVYSLKEN